MKQQILWIARGVALAYWIFLSLLIVLPNPWILFGFEQGPFSPPNIGVHFTTFTLLALFLTLARLPIRLSQLYGLLIVYAATIELSQYFTPPRTVELDDFIENMLGLTVGVLLGKAVLCFFRSHETPAANDTDAKS